MAKLTTYNHPGPFSADMLLDFIILLVNASHILVILTTTTTTTTTIMLR